MVYTSGLNTLTLSGITADPSIPLAYVQYSEPVLPNGNDYVPFFFFLGGSVVYGTDKMGNVVAGNPQ